MRNAIGRPTFRKTSLPANKRPEDDVQLYGVFAQSPAEANQALNRPLPTGFSNTALLNGGTLDGGKLPNRGSALYPAQRLR
jgi:hypothetical protein